MSIRFKIWVSFLAVVTFASCIDPVTPEFEFFDGQINIEAYASTVPRSSYVIINKANTEFGIYRTLFETGARVAFINSATGESVLLNERDDDYVPPQDFVVQVGETWELDILLADGKEIKSEPETVVALVPIDEVTSNYNPELKFRESSGKFVSGHTVNISFNDPVASDNFYFWRFTSFEKLNICQFCGFGIFRNGECRNDGTAHMYDCESDCWKIRFNESISIFSDEFTNGTRITNLPVGEVLLYTRENIVVQIEQLALSPKAYDYFKTLKDLVDNNRGLNAPPPAALLGNLYDVGDNEQYVTGRFTAAAMSTYSIFINREVIEESPLEPQPNAPYEDALNGIIEVPCLEGRFRTSIRPAAWQDL